MLLLSFLFGVAIGTVFSTLIFKLVAKGRVIAKAAAKEATAEIEKAKTRI